MYGWHVWRTSLWHLRATALNVRRWVAYSLITTIRDFQSHAYLWRSFPALLSSFDNRSVRLSLLGQMYGDNVDRDGDNHNGRIDSPY